MWCNKNTIQRSHRVCSYQSLNRFTTTHFKKDIVPSSLSYSYSKSGSLSSFPPLKFGLFLSLSSAISSQSQNTLNKYPNFKSSEVSYLTGSNQLHGIGSKLLNACSDHEKTFIVTEFMDVFQQVEKQMCLFGNHVDTNTGVFGQIWTNMDDDDGV